MAKDPAVLFYTSDFLIGTEFMSFEQKGQYIHLLCHQHQSGHIPTDYMARVLGSQENPVWKKFIQDTNGNWINVRMDEESEKRKRFSESRRANVSKRYEDSQDSTHVDTSVDTTGVRMVNEDEDVNTNTDNLLKAEEPIDPVKIVDKWNMFAKSVGIPVVLKITDSRKKHVLSRFTEKDFDFGKILEAIRGSPFCLGEGSKGWKVDFDFVFASRDNYIKILEGKYANNGRSSAKNNKPAPGTQAARIAFEHGDAELKNIVSLKESLDERDRQRSQRARPG